jgi:hypothetical protein
VKGLQMLELKQNHDNVNEARNTSIFNNSILNSKIDRYISCVPVALIFEFNIELLNIDVFLASFTLSSCKSVCKRTNDLVTPAKWVVFLRLCAVQIYSEILRLIWSA